MNFPPMLMRVLIDKEAHYVNLWLPLFLIAPLGFIVLFAVFLLLLPFALMATIVLWLFDVWRPIIYFWPGMLGLLAALRGLEVDIENDDQVYIAFK